MSGFRITPKNCLAYDERDSTYRRCPSAYNVSNASELLPLPERPVKTTNLFLGIWSDKFLRLCSRAPVIVIKSGVFDIEIVIKSERNCRQAVEAEPAIVAENQLTFL